MRISGNPLPLPYPESYSPTSAGVASASGMEEVRERADSLPNEQPDPGLPGRHHDGGCSGVLAQRRFERSPASDEEVGRRTGRGGHVGHVGRLPSREHKNRDLGGIHPRATEYLLRQLTNAAVWFVVVGATAGSVLASCDRGTPTPDTSGNAQSLIVEATSPVAEEADVPVDRVIRVRFNRLLRPETAVRQSIRVTGGSLDADGGSVAGNAFLTPTYDPVERVVSFALPGGATWEPGVRYTVTLFRPSDRPDDGFGFRAWDTGELPESVTFSFTTASDGRVDTPKYPAVNSGFCAICVDQKIVKGAKDAMATCAIPGCHSSANDARGASGLLLDTRASFENTAIGHVAHQTVTTPSSTEAQTNSYRFGHSMPIIDPGSPGNSYLMIKLLMNDKNFTSISCDASGTSAETCAPNLKGAASPFVAPNNGADISHMRESFLMGEGMPLGFGLMWVDVQTISAWISAGAPLVDDGACPDLSACVPAATGGTGGTGGVGGSAGSGASGGTSNGGAGAGGT